jgi:hypothetical protein
MLIFRSARSWAEGDSRSDAPTLEGGVSDRSAQELPEPVGWHEEQQSEGSGRGSLPICRLQQPGFMRCRASLVQ